MSSTSNEPPSNNVGERDGTKAEKESLTDWYVDDTTTGVSLSIYFFSVHVSNNRFGQIACTYYYLYYFWNKQYALAISSMCRWYWLGYGVFSEIQKRVSTN